MIKKLLLGILFFTSIYTFAQDKKWSVEANYSIVPSNGFGGDDTVIGAGVKYNIIKNSILNFGISLNAASVTKNSFFSGVDPNASLYIFQPRAFTEINLPFSKRLRPTLGLGYSFFSGSTFPSNAPEGFNLNIGLLYDISDKWFIQLSYDVIRSQSINPSEGFNNFRLGVGFRF